MRRLCVALPALALLAGSSFAYAEDMTAPGGAMKNGATEGRATTHENRAMSGADSNGKVEQASPGPGGPPSSEAKGP